MKLPDQSPGREAAPDDPSAAARLLPNHPLRHALNNELHARPFIALRPPERISHLALFSGEQAGPDDHACLARLCERYGVAPPQIGVNHFVHDFGPFRLKWERHTEFSTYTFLQRVAVEDPFRVRAVDDIALDWLDQLSGRVLVAANVALLSREAAEPTSGDLARYFAPDAVIGSLVSGGAAAVYADYRIHGDGFSRILVHDRGLGEHQAGRLVQRLLEIDTYRMMALLALPLARDLAADIADCERALLEATAAMAEAEGAAEERAMLDRLTRLAALTERLSAKASYRLRATRAYHAIVERRIRELREERLSGLQTVREFMDRRLAPAMQTCASTVDRLDNLSRGVARVSELLRTRVDVTVAEQNRNLLKSMARRGRLQFHLQEMVEGLSVVAITYYAVGLVTKMVRALEPLNGAVDADIVGGAAAPIVFLGAWLGLRRLRRRLLQQAAEEI